MKKTKLLAFIIIAMTTLMGCKKSIDIREDFVAIYSVTETWTENSKTLTKLQFSMPVYKSALNKNMLLLDNFANYNVTVEATVSGNILTIPQQTLSNSKAINGLGTLAGTILTFTYCESCNGISTTVSTIAKMK